MIAVVSLKHFSWSFKLGNFIMLNILDTLNETLQGHYCLNSCYKLFKEKNAMLAAGRLTPFSWSFKLGSFIMINVSEALDKILRKDHRFNHFYYLFIAKNRYHRCD